MLFNPAIIALLLASGLSLALFASSSGFGWQVVRHWDITSGSELQVRMERRTYLISTLLAFVFAAELVSLLLFVFNADRLADRFVGAMCAVGTLNVNPYGWPTLFLKMAVFFMASTWLVVNHLDNRGYDYPLTRIKYRLLLLILPFAAAEVVVQYRYFAGLDADIITSCCGSLFSADSPTLAAEVSSLPPGLAMAGFYALLAAVVGMGAWAWRSGRGGLAYALASLLGFAASLGAVVSFVSLYAYEHPHHHCPFCILKPEYDYLGYALYLPLFAATALGLGAGAVHRFRAVPSLAEEAPRLYRRLTGLSAALFGLFAVLVTVVVLRSHLKLIGG
jgi:hypothetical protein